MNESFQEFSPIKNFLWYVTNKVTLRNSSYRISVEFIFSINVEIIKIISNIHKHQLKTTWLLILTFIASTGLHNV